MNMVVFIVFNLYLNYCFYVEFIINYNLIDFVDYLEFIRKNFDLYGKFLSWMK